MDDTRLNQLLDAAFYGYAREKIARAQQDARAFVHYTTTEAALSIIDNNEIWLRNSGVMNDYSEMAHGESCLRYCLFEEEETAARARRIFDGITPGLYDRALHWLSESSAKRRAHTYLLSISEHGSTGGAPDGPDPESEYGRLSMWRAYGSQGGVALVFDQRALMNPANVLDVYVSPVFYGTPAAFAHEFNRMLAHLEANFAVVKTVDPDRFWTHLQAFLHFSGLACKHPGFAEEREWRVTYSADPASEHAGDADYNAASKIKRSFRAIGGLPQRIYKLPFVDYPEEGLESLRLSTILRQVVIGPTQYPHIVFDSVHMAMRRAGFAEEDIRISVSEIPLRI